LISELEEKRDAQSIYRELKKHALGSTETQLSGEALLQYITTTRHPGTWRGNLFNFVLHWKEQVMKFGKLKLEEFPPKQKLRMFQNNVGEVSELAYVKPIGDQDIASDNPPLVYKTYSCCLHVPHMTRTLFYPVNRNALYMHRNLIRILTALTIRHTVLIPMLRTLWRMRLIQIDPLVDKNTVT
jgi:hypothetical protein